jgi:hypothetical protein
VSSGSPLSARRGRDLVDQRSDEIAQSLLEPLSLKQRGRVTSAVHEVERLLRSGERCRSRPSILSTACAVQPPDYVAELNRGRSAASTGGVPPLCPPRSGASGGVLVVPRLSPDAAAREDVPVAVELSGGGRWVLCGRERSGLPGRH